MSALASDPHASRFALRLDGDGSATRLELGTLNGLPDGPGTHWVHLDYSQPRDREWLTAASGLDGMLVEALLAEDTRPRTSTVGDGLLLALRGVNLAPDADPEDMVSIRIWIDRSRIVTSHKRELLSVTDLVDCLDRGTGPAGPGEFLEMLADRLVARMSDTIDQLEDRVADLEERLVDSGTRDMRYELAALRRQAITLRRYLAPQREALSRLVAEKVDWIADAERHRLREVGDRLVRYVEDLDAVRERAAVTQEELLSRVSEQMNARMYVLSILSAVFLPLGFLTGLLGVNLGGIPGSGDAHAFWIFLAGLVVAVLLQLLLLRWRRWF